MRFWLILLIFWLVIVANTTFNASLPQGSSQAFFAATSATVGWLLFFVVCMIIAEAVKRYRRKLEIEKEIETDKKIAKTLKEIELEELGQAQIKVGMNKTKLSLQRKIFNFFEKLFT